MRRNAILWIIISLLMLVLMLGGAPTAMAATKKGPAHHKMKIVKTGKPPAPKYTPRKKPAKAAKPHASPSKDASKAKKA